MANHRIRASAATRVVGVGIRTIYMAAPRPRGLTLAIDPARVQHPHDIIYAATGDTIRVMWEMTPPAQVYEVQVYRVSMGDGTLPSLIHAAEVTAPMLNWRPPRAGLYSIRVRARVDEQLTGWVTSNEPVISANGASRGWLIQVYLAPVSGGGIR